MSLHELPAHRLVFEPEQGHATTGQPVKRVRRRLGVSWATIILFAVVISYVNGFWVTALQITVGSLERSEPPFGRWLRDSSIMVPLYAAGVLVAVLLARRWFGRSKRTLVRAAGAGVLIVAVCTLVGIVEVANSAAYDYQLQTEHIDVVDGFNHTQHDGDIHRRTDRRLRRDLRGQAINPRAPRPSRHPGQRTHADHQRIVGHMAARGRRRPTLATLEAVDDAG